MRKKCFVPNQIIIIFCLLFFIFSCKTSVHNFTGQKFSVLKSTQNSEKIIAFTGLEKDNEKVEIYPPDIDAKEYFNEECAEISGTQKIKSPHVKRLGKVVKGVKLAKTDYKKLHFKKPLITKNLLKPSKNTYLYIILATLVLGGGLFLQGYFYNVFILEVIGALILLALSGVLGAILRFRMFGIDVLEKAFGIGAIIFFILAAIFGALFYTSANPIIIILSLFLGLALAILFLGYLVAWLVLRYVED